MKILIATDTYYPSVNGAAYFTYRLANALVQKGHTVFVICPSRSFNDTITNEKGVVVYGIRSLRIPVYQNFRMSPLAISKKSIDRVVQEISPDVVHIQNHFMIGKGVALAAKRLGISVMGTNHFMPENLVHYFHLPKFAERKLIAFGWNQCIKVFEQLDFVTTPTKTAADLLRKAGFGNEITPISCGIDLNRFNPRNDGAYLKERYNIPDRPVLLYVGRLDKEKRIEVILHALQTILKDMEVQLVLAGVGKLRIPLEIKAQEMGVRHYVTFTEFVPDEDLANLYKVADIFVNAGIAELQSIVTMEAMASGLPVVAVNAMALPELVHDGENGYLFPDGNSHMLAGHITKILSDPVLKHRIGQKSLEIIQHHDIQKTISAFEGAYHQIIRQPATHYVPVLKPWYASRPTVGFTAAALAVIAIVVPTFILTEAKIMESPEIIVKDFHNSLLADADFQDVQYRFTHFKQRIKTELYEKDYAPEK